MHLVELKQVSKSYDKNVQVLHSIDLQIEEGEFFVLVGPSGSGKSTLLRMIAGLESLSGGELKIQGRLVNHLPPKERHLSMVFQNYALYPHLTVEQNILFGLSAKKVNKQEQQKRLQEAVSMMGLGDLLKRKPKQLSGGQRQRVALARSVISQEPLCLMDEPLSNLDAKLRAHMRTEIRRLQKKLGLTMIYVTHDQVEAMTMGDRIMVLNEGEIQQIGKPIDLYNQPANLFVASFIGSPRMNLGLAVINQNQLIIEDTIKLSITNQDIPKIIKRSGITIGIRAEHLVYATQEEANLHLDVVNVEQLGNETLLTFEVGSQLWTAKWLGQWLINAGERIPLKINLDHISFFDSQSGQIMQTATASQDLKVVAL
ncbi:ABC transporter ATP-binding protein [Amphibacillus marinus]|nr:ABC transporter ATP-binding protein [Amphibacillus marinus]